MPMKYIETMVPSGKTMELSTRTSKGSRFNFGNGTATVRLMRPIKLKWQWRVTYQLNQHGEWETYTTEPFESRRHARQFKQLIPVIARNVKIQRRLVQTDWGDYNDSFGWNRGCGKR